MRTRFDTDARDTQGTTFLTGLLCGVAAGAALGLMLAPKPGRELRRQIADSTDALRQKAVDAGQAVRTRLGRDAGAVVSAAGAAAHDVRQQADDAVASVIDAGRSTLGRMAAR
jgi:gas vesicle protein